MCAHDRKGPRRGNNVYSKDELKTNLDKKIRHVNSW